MTRPLQTITSSKEDLEGNNPANGSCHDVTTKDNTAVDRVVKQEKDEHEEDHHKIERDVPEGTVLDGTFMSCIRDTSQLSKHLEETSRPTCGAANDAPPALSTSQSKAAHENTSAEPPLKVLVVDDDPLTRTLMSRVRFAVAGCVSAIINRAFLSDGDTDLERQWRSHPRDR